MVDFKPRKSYEFKDCVPFIVEGGAISYGDLDISVARILCVLMFCLGVDE